MMNYANTVAQNDMTFSYHPMPFSMMLKVNRHLIKIRSQPLLHQTSTTNLSLSRVARNPEYACLEGELKWAIC